MITGIKLPGGEVYNAISDSTMSRSEPRFEPQPNLITVGTYRAHVLAIPPGERIHTSQMEVWVRKVIYVYDTTRKAEGKKEGHRY